MFIARQDVLPHALDLMLKTGAVLALLISGNPCIQRNARHLANPPIFDPENFIALGVLAKGKDPSIFDTLAVTTIPHAVTAWRREQSMPSRRPQPITGFVYGTGMSPSWITIGDECRDIGSRSDNPTTEARELLRTAVRCPDEAPAREFQPAPMR